MSTMRIRGLGVVTPAGAGRGVFVETLRGGESLIGESAIRKGSLAAEITAPPKSFLRRKGLIPLSRSSLLAAGAVEDLFASEGAPAEDECGETCGLVVGTAYGHVDSKARFHATAREEGVGLVSPIVFPNTIINSLAGHTAILFGLRGPNSTVTSGRRSGLEALLRARTLLLSGRAERIVVAGCDEVAESLLEGLAAKGELAADGSGWGRPGEAAVAFVLEPCGAEDGSMALLGQSEASVVSRTLEEACAQAMRRALETAGVAADGVEWAALSTCGDARLDEAEEAAFRDVFGDGTRAVRPKEIFGETYGAAGLLGCATAVVDIDAGSSAGPVLVSAVDATGAMAVLIGRH